MTCTVEEAAEMLGIARHTAYQAARSGELPTIRIGRRLLVPLSRLEALLNDERPAGNGALGTTSAGGDGRYETAG